MLCTLENKAIRVVLVEAIANVCSAAMKCSVEWERVWMVLNLQKR